MTPDVEGAYGGKQAPWPSVMHKNNAKNKWFPLLIDIKIVENAVFPQPA
jgi:hypothetical protein